MNGLASRRPDHHHQSLAQPSNRLDAHFPIIETGVLLLKDRGRQNRSRINEVEPALTQGDVALGRIEGDAHGLV